MQFIKDLKKILSSRTVLTLLLMFAFNIVDIAGAQIDPTTLVLVNTFLTALATFFRINVKQTFKDTKKK